jgi:hypothetical protein
MSVQAQLMAVSRPQQAQGATGCLAAAGWSQLVLLAAPSGFGKTSLLAEWPVMEVELDDRADDDARRDDRGRRIMAPAVKPAAGRRPRPHPPGKIAASARRTAEVRRQTSASGPARNINKAQGRQALHPRDQRHHVRRRFRRAVAG